jgi:hypothetical protein
MCTKKNRSNLSIWPWSILIENVPFFHFDLEKDGQGHKFSRLKYEKRVVGEALKILNYYTHKSDVWFGL